MTTCLSNLPQLQLWHELEHESSARALFFRGWRGLSATSSWINSSVQLLICTTSARDCDGCLRDKLCLCPRPKQSTDLLPPIFWKALFYIWTFNLSCLTSEKRSRIKYMYIYYPTLKPKHKKHNSTSWNRSNLFHLLEIRITPVWVVTTNFVVGGIESLMVVYPRIEENTTPFHFKWNLKSIPLDLPIYRCGWEGFLKPKKQTC